MSTRTHALLIMTQYSENYGWDGEGNLNPDGPWKHKGGTDYLITGLDAEADNFEQMLVVDAVRDRVEWSDTASESYILSVAFVPASFAFGDWRDEMIERIENPRLALEVPV